MKIIAITSPRATDDDLHLITSLIEKGIDTIHLRKPESTIDECRSLLSKLTPEQRSKIVIHDFAELYTEFSLAGIHINRNITSLPADYAGLKTRSCHSLEEVRMHKADYDYLFLSPIFDSISKTGYKSAFNKSDLLKASLSGTIDHRVIALGGVTLDDIPYLKGLNFGGIAMIGGIYNAKIVNSITNINLYK